VVLSQNAALACANAAFSFALAEPRRSFPGMIRAIIFDLDNCLAPADGMGRDFMDPVFEAIRNANRGAVSEEALALAFADMWRVPLDAVAEQYGFSQEMLRAGWEISVRLEVKGGMRDYGDLQQVADWSVKKFLVTSGFSKLQNSKIAALGIARWADGVFVDAIDRPERKGKQGLFEEIAKEHGLQPQEVLVVGDNPESEIAAGNRLGMTTVQIIRPGVPCGDTASYVVQSLDELVPLIRGEG
jgi:FMN phosphatase YigB (HAD superfamily)